MTRLNIEIGALWVTWMAAVSGRPGIGGVPPEWIALMLRTALPVAPKLSDMLFAMQAAGPWHHVVAAVTA